MITSKIVCGFGNQLFCYAIGYALSKRLGTTCIHDCLTFDAQYDRALELPKLNVTGKLVTMNAPKAIRFLRRMMLRAGKTVVEEKEELKRRYDPAFDQLKDNTYLIGYWQNYRYFNAYKQELIREFTPKQLSGKANEWIAKVSEGDHVAIHVRRGDYVSLNLCLGEAYYLSAIEAVRRQLGEKAKLLFFSDDIAWARKTFGSVEGADFFDADVTDLESFYIMSACRHHVIANSTYSWWAAYLNDSHEGALTIAPALEGYDYYPAAWQTI